jgi:hypothetical protein
MLADRRARAGIAHIASLARRNALGVNAADISVCVSIAPYAPLTTGKLIAMLCASPEVVRLWRDTFAGRVSTLRSRLAGREIYADRSDLMLLTTTSVYATHSAQYNRIRVPGELLGGDDIRYVELGKSAAFGVGHLAPETRRLASRLAYAHGWNKLADNRHTMHKLSKALNVIGWTDKLLVHGRPRIVYSVPLVHNAREALMGLEPPKWRYPVDPPDAVPSSVIVDYWLERWARQRIQRPEVLAQMERHSLEDIDNHGAKVVLPPLR